MKTAALPRGATSTLLSRFQSGDRAALGRLISYVEDRSDGYHTLLSKVFKHEAAAYRIGVTGPPGAGKSSLVNRLALKLANDGHSIGVIAVDPTSPFTGGAVLGDRIRMQSLYGHDNIFVRSMATRGSPGGLASAAKDVCVLMEGFGFDLIFVETVGVGQVELDVASVCDSVMVVFVPESGDAIQAMKSGLMEIADVFCINKADRPGADRVKAELESVLEIRREVQRSIAAPDSPPPSLWNPPVEMASALKDEGIPALWQAVERHRAFRKSQEPQGHRRNRARADLLMSIAELSRTGLEAELYDTPRIDDAVEAIVSGQSDPYTSARNLFGQWRTGGQ
ncbi:MAG TPA: methylmalonyl Co-A mutase-associated GTPase MeaB [candidate division Zixibacteria bacterium]